MACSDIDSVRCILPGGGCDGSCGVSLVAAATASLTSSLIGGVGLVEEDMVLELVAGSSTDARRVILSVNVVFFSIFVVKPMIYIILLLYYIPVYCNVSGATRSYL